MKLRDALMNLAITAALVLVIVLVALVLKRSQPSVPKAIPVNPAGAASYDGGKPVLEMFEALQHAELIETRANEADTLRFRIGPEEHVFVLYFIDALDASLTHPQRVNDQARWFGGATSQQIVDSGLEALQFVRDLLAAKPFEVLTRWERVPNTTRYYALVRVEIEPGKRVYLADLLMRAGYARIGGVTTFLPDDSRTETDYLLNLKKLGEQARTARAGIWAKTAK